MHTALARSGNSCFPDSREKCTDVPYCRASSLVFREALRQGSSPFLFCSPQLQRNAASRPGVRCEYLAMRGLSGASGRYSPNEFLKAYGSASLSDGGRQSGFIAVIMTNATDGWPRFVPCAKLPAATSRCLVVILSALGNAEAFATYRDTPARRAEPRHDTQ